MNKLNAGYIDFLDKKFIPLKTNVKIAIAVAIIVLIGVGFYFFQYSPKTETIERLTRQEQDLERRLVKIRKRASNKEKLKQDLAKTQELFEAYSVLLPKDKEIPQLLKDISSLGINAGLDFQSFTPGNDIPKDFYAEIPVSINFNGPYHNLGYFLDKVSKLNRIVTVNNINLGGGKMDSGEMILRSTCRLITYRFTNKPLNQPKKGKRR